jgi:hypothetical protein
VSQTQIIDGPGSKPTPVSVSTVAPYRARVNLDVDGVVGDFDGHCVRLFGASSRELEFQHDDGRLLKGDPALWEYVHREPTFWLDMPLFPHAHELVDLVRPYGVQFLTGCPVNEGYDRAEAEKRIKLANHWPDLHVITCRSKHKALHMQEPGDILVDDFVANIKRWEKAGGTAIYFRNFDRALADLKTALERQFPDVV